MSSMIDHLCGKWWKRKYYKHFIYHYITEVNLQTNRMQVKTFYKKKFKDESRYIYTLSHRFFLDLVEPNEQELEEIIQRSAQHL